MKKTAVCGWLLVLPDHIIEDGTVVAEDSRIVFAGESSAAGAILTGAALFDASGKIILPGFVDTHVHGALGEDFMNAARSAFEKIIHYHTSHGTTTLLPTSATAPADEILAFLAALADYMDDTGKKPAAGLPGCHIEGNYIDPSRAGCQNPANLRHADPVEYEPILRDFGRYIRRWTFAPEVEGAEDFARRLRELDIVPVAGHTNISTTKFLAAFHEYIKFVAHLFCDTGDIMTQPVSENLIRDGGITEALWLCDDISTEIIGDGYHVSEIMLRVALRCIGNTERICLVTDASEAAGMPPGDYVFGKKETGLRFKSNGAVGYLAGSYASSLVSMDQVVGRIWKLSGLPLNQVVNMASLNPARAFKLTGKGALLPGFDADILIADYNRQAHASPYEPESNVPTEVDHTQYDLVIEKVFIGGELFEEQIEKAQTD